METGAKACPWDGLLTGPESDGSGGQQSCGKKNVITAVEAVARMLGNTAAICRKCYIHPVIITRYMDGRLARTLRVKTDSEISEHLRELKPEEATVLSLLREELERRSVS